ncbi:TetR/AcrR family transcriptional regulator [Kineosporia sp. J2-2]|uniref:TetR/AcrR family transcriptional regulator n=1 Tax=Kineosporia corallincola TaxID=2835133 RepID=A0ABS5TGB6_9ACTN|nr:TetR/AcrR family transcriptional regulator [Kineosporia corallincola]MBT0770133.1 TetR/AcrR family transcriptional regulator [Kineosporia corallincola]
MTDRGGSAPRKRGRPTAAERARRRDDILDAAVRLLVEGGYNQVTLDDIVAEARVTKRTIYGYFGDRTEIFLAAVERLRRRTLEQPTTEGSLEELAINIVVTAHSDQSVGLHRLMIIESHSFPELAQRFYREGPMGYIQAIEARMPRPDRERATSLFTLLLGEAHRQRLLGLKRAPSRDEAVAHARRAMDHLGLR